MNFSFNLYENNIDINLQFCHLFFFFFDFFMRLYLKAWGSQKSYLYIVFLLESIYTARFLNIEIAK